MNKKDAVANLTLYESFTRQCMSIDELCDICRVSYIDIKARQRY